MSFLLKRNVSVICSSVESGFTVDNTTRLNLVDETFSYSQASQIAESSRNQIGSLDRGSSYFTASLAPAQFSFSTYLSASTGSIPDEILWEAITNSSITDIDPIDFSTSNVAQLPALFFWFDHQGATYKLTDAVLNSATIEMNLSGLPIITWSGTAKALTPIIEDITDFEGSVIDSAPQWYWKLDETSGTPAVDTMGNNDIEYYVDSSTMDIASSLSDGTGRAKEKTESSEKGLKALDIDRLIVGDLTQDFTIELAANIGTLGDTNPIMVGKWDNSSPSNRLWWLGLLTSGELTFRLYQSSGTQRYTTLTSSPLSTGSWMYISVRGDYSGTGLLTCHINGVEVNSTDMSGWSGIWRSNASRLRIFRDDAINNATSTFTGSLDEVQIYQKAITDVERANNYPWWAKNTAPVPTVYTDYKGFIPEVISKLTTITFNRSGVVSPTDMVAHWAFEEDTGSSLLDSSGNNLTLSPSGSMNLEQTGQVSRCVDVLSGGNQLGSVTGDLFQVPSFSTSFWIKSAGLTTASTQVQMAWNYNISTDIGYFIQINKTTGVAHLALGNGSSSPSVASSLTSVIDGTWHHIAVTYSSSGDAAFYVDGVSKGTSTGNSFATATESFALTSRGGASYAYNGLIDEYKFFDRAISAEEVTAMYAEEKGLPSATKVYTLVLTDLSVTMDNNVEWVGRTRLGRITTPETHYLRNRAISGNMTMYLKTGTSKVLLDDLLTDLITNTEYTYTASINLGGSTNFVKLDMPKLIINAPETNIDEAVTLSVPFKATETTAKAGDEITITFS